MLDFLKGPFTAVIGAIGGVIDSLHTSGEEKLAAHAKLLEINTAFQLKLVEADVEWAKTQAEVLKAEATSASWLARNWRPLTMLTFVVIICSIVWTGGFINGREINPTFVTEILSIIKIGLGGYVVGRSAEKIAPAVASIFTGKTK